MSEPLLVARSKPKLWYIPVSIAAAVLCGWMAREVSDPEFHTNGRGAALINMLGPDLAPWFFAAVSVACLLVAGITVIRRFNPKEELIITADQIVSNQVGGRGTIKWADIERLSRQQFWLYVHGRAVDGKQRKLAINLNGLDRNEAEIVATLKARRPDLFAS
mgnify:CR=1 FL=1